MPQLTTTATILRRSDFRESSRIVTVVTREHGRIAGLAKGAHRPDSPFLGRIDFLNEVRATFSADRGGLRLLVRAELLRERRALRSPERFVAACHLAQLSEFTMPDQRPEPAAYDLLAGGLTLLERCPPTRLPRVVLGLELRFLAHLGALPDLDHCAECGAPLGDRAYRVEDSLAFFCGDHGRPPRHVMAPAVLQLLRFLRDAPGRDWPRPDSRFDDVAMPLARSLPGAWLATATELRPRWRRLVFA